MQHSASQIHNDGNIILKYTRNIIMPVTVIQSAVQKYVEMMILPSVRLMRLPMCATCSTYDTGTAFSDTSTGVSRRSINLLGIITSVVHYNAIFVRKRMQTVHL